MHYFYILYSEKRDRYYYGHSSDVYIRLVRHNEGWSKSTKSGIPWKLVYYEKYSTKSEAIKRELEVKGWKSRKLVVDLIENWKNKKLN
jgi:putative endonuclease